MDSNTLLFLLWNFLECVRSQTLKVGQTLLEQGQFASCAELYQNLCEQFRYGGICCTIRAPPSSAPHLTSVGMGVQPNELAKI
jgi:hypothetical protein